MGAFAPPCRSYSTNSDTESVESHTTEEQGSEASQPKNKSWHVHETDAGTVELNMNSNPLNCLNQQFFDDFHETLQYLENHVAPHKPLVFKSQSNSVFSAGLDLAEVTSLESEDAALDFIDQLNRCFTKLYLLKRPTIAVVANKHAIAGGLIFSLCCDFQIVCTENNNAQYGLKEIALGVPFPSQTYYIIEQVISDRALFREMTMTGYWVPVKEAIDRRLFSHQVSNIEQVDGKVKEIVSRYSAEKGHDAFVQIKAMMRSDPFREWMESNHRDVMYYDNEFLRCLMKDSTKQLMKDAIGGKSKPKKEEPSFE